MRYVHQWGIICFAVLTLAACTSVGTADLQQGPAAPVTLKARVVPPDSIRAPEVVQADTTRFVRGILRGERVQADRNVHTLVGPTTVRSMEPVVRVPGVDTLPLPAAQAVIPEHIAMNAPPLVQARDPGSRDRNRYNFTFYNKLQGLRHNSLYCLLEDHLGALWLGTAGAGVTRFDGRNFMHFGMEQGFDANHVFGMVQARDSALWFATDAGIFRFDGHGFKRYSKANGLPVDRTVELFEDRDGGIWSTTADGGLVRLRNDSLVVLPPSEGMTWRVTAISQDPAGRMWFGSPGGLHLYDGNAFVHFRLDPSVFKGSAREFTWDRHGHLWFSSSQYGVFRTELPAVQISAAAPMACSFYSGSVEVPFDKARALYNDGEGGIWVGIWGNGMVRMADPTYGEASTFTHFSVAQGLPEIHVRRFLRDRHGDLWIATNGGGVVRYDPHSFTHYTDQEGLLGNYAYGLVEDEEGQLWIATGDGG
jgi:ligand-binding sensor domain-containing protein